MAAPWELAGMRRAIALSAFGLGTTSPNPPVGCVIFDRAGRPVGEGHHERKGEAHAETRALSGAGPAAAGGTAVVTLEPCNHFGRTPPCHQALIDAGIRRVVIGVLDPTSRGQGGAARLQAAGVSVEVGVGEQEARLVLGPWLAALHTGRPTVTWAHQVPATSAGHGGHGGHGDHGGRDPQYDDLAELRAGRDIVIYGDGRVAEGRPGGHGTSAFCLPNEPLPRDPHDALAVLAGSGARTVLLSGGPDLAGPFLASDLVDDVVLHLPPAPADPGKLGGPPSAFHLPPGFRLMQVVRTAGGLRITGVAARE